MILPDVNILVYAHRPEMPHHKKVVKTLQNLPKQFQTLCLSQFIICGFLRIVTSPKIFKQPTSGPEAFKFIDTLMDSPSTKIVEPSENFWGIFKIISQETSAKSAFFSDVYIAALAIEHNLDLFTFDTDFKKFSSLSLYQA